MSWRMKQPVFHSIQSRERYESHIRAARFDERQPGIDHLPLGRVNLLLDLALEFC